MVVAVPRILIVGLGNLPFPMTRHSIGHLILDSLASRLGIHFANDRALGGLSARTNVVIGENSVDVTLFKPKAFMNISGRPVATALRNSVGSPASMIVIHDSLSHKPNTISPKSGGSANGHNGVKSIIAALGGEMNFHRFRIGIGRDGSDAAEYVLGKLSPGERIFWGQDGKGTDLIWNELEKTVQRVIRDG